MELMPAEFVRTRQRVHRRVCSAMRTPLERHGQEGLPGSSPMVGGVTLDHSAPFATVCQISPWRLSFVPSASFPTTQPAYELVLPTVTRGQLSGCPFVFEGVPVPRCTKEIIGASTKA